MRRGLHQLLLFAGALYGLAGLVQGLSEAPRAWPELLAALAAIAAGALAAGATTRSTPLARRPLTALGALAPVTLLPATFQPIHELGALRLLAVAAALDTALTLSATTSDPGPSSRRRRLPWLVLAYGGAVALAAIPDPLRIATIGWAALCVSVVVIASARRMRRPADVLQESAAHHGLWAVVTAIAVGMAFAALTGFETGLPLAVGAALFALGALRAAVAYEAQDTSFSTRHAAAPVVVAALIALAAWLVSLQGAQWSASGVVAMLLGVALLSPPLAELTRVILDRIPPDAARALDDVVDRFEQREPTTPDLDELLTALTPLAATLPRGSLALVSFDPDWTAVLSDAGIEHRATSPGEPFRDILATPDRCAPLLAEQIIKRSVRQTDLRPASELIAELETDLVVPIPGGDEGSLAGALLVGRPARGFLRGRRAARLHRLARLVGAQLRAAVLLERAGRRIAELEQSHAQEGDEVERLRFQLARLNEENRLLRRDRAGTAAAEVVGRSKAMRDLLERVDAVADIECSVLIRGEAGTGRTLVARLLHQASSRREAPLVQLSCVGTPSSQHLEKLLGRADGAVARPGLVELADGGTLLLQEIGALSLEAQAELVRILASGDVARESTGESGPAARPVDVRIIGTTGRTSERALARDALIPELYDRLRTAELEVPPLRERRGDVAELATFFIDRATRLHGLDPLVLDDEALALLEAYPWPGNVRQLRAVLEHAVLVARPPRIKAIDLPRLSDSPPAEAESDDLPEGTFDDIEREILQRALLRARGNKAEAARRLGMKRTTFASRLKKAGL